MILFLLMLIVSTFAWDQLIGFNISRQALILFQTLSEHNGRRILSGQTTDYYDQLKALIGASPVIRGFDMQNYSPHNPWFNWEPTDDGTIAKAIEWYKSTNGGGIVSFQWHWFSPAGGELRTSTFYTNNTNFDVRKAVEVNTLEYNLTLRDIDAIAVQLKRLQNAKVPILWRPLHEAGGGWFWWGAKGAAPTKKLLDIIFERIDKHHGINNLIWVWSTPEVSWYPGKDRVDIIGYDSYPGSHNYDCNLKMFMQLRNIVNATKMVVLSENGPIPDPQKCWNSGAMWGYFMSWSNLVVQQNSPEHIESVYRHPKVRTLENM